MISPLSRANHLYLYPNVDLLCEKPKHNDAGMDVLILILALLIHHLLLLLLLGLFHLLYFLHLLIHDDAEIDGCRADRWGSGSDVIGSRLQK